MGAVELPDGRRRYSSSFLWGASIVFLVGCMISVELICLGALYFIDTFRGRDTSHFALQYLVTRPFASQPNPAPGKRFLGNLDSYDLFWGKIYTPDSLLGWRMAPNIAAWQGDEVYLYITDSNGFISSLDDPPISATKPQDVYRIIVLGGSTVMGQGARFPSDNLVGMLRKIAAERKVTGPEGQRVEFVNAGVGGYQSGQEYLYLASDLLRFHPDLVIVYDGWNDSVYQNRLLTKYWVSSALRTEQHREMSRRVADSFSVGGSLRLFLRNAGNALRSHHSGRLAAVELLERVTLRIWPFRSRAVGAKKRAEIRFDPRSIQLYGQNLKSMLALGHDGDFRVALFLQPLAGVDGKTFSDKEKAARWFPRVNSEMRYRGPFYQAARTMLVGLNEVHRKPAACIADLSRVFAGTGETVYADTGHLLPRGNEIVAQRMIDELISCRQVLEETRH